jgi:hypothetical protein
MTARARALLPSTGRFSSGVTGRIRQREKSIRSNPGFDIKGHGVVMKGYTHFVIARQPDSGDGCPIKTMNRRKDRGRFFLLTIPDHIRDPGERVSGYRLLPTDFGLT